MIDTERADEGFIWNLSNCECKCNKSCDIGEYLDYENCRCRKDLIDRLVKKCKCMYLDECLYELTNVRIW